MSTNTYRDGSRAGGNTKFENYGSANNNNSKYSSSSSLKSKLQSAREDPTISGRVQVAVRLRPQNSEEMVADADFADCVELQPELK